MNPTDNFENAECIQLEKSKSYNETYSEVIDLFPMERDEYFKNDFDVSDTHNKSSNTCTMKPNSNTSASFELPFLDKNFLEMLDFDKAIKAVSEDPSIFEHYNSDIREISDILLTSYLQMEKSTLLFVEKPTLQDIIGSLEVGKETIAIGDLDLQDIMDSLEKETVVIGDLDSQFGLSVDKSTLITQHIMDSLEIGKETISVTVGDLDSQSVLSVEKQTHITQDMDSLEIGKETATVSDLNSQSGLSVEKPTLITQDMDSLEIGKETATVYIGDFNSQSVLSVEKPTVITQDVMDTLEIRKKSISVVENPDSQSVDELVNIEKDTEGEISVKNSESTIEKINANSNVHINLVGNPESIYSSLTDINCWQCYMKMKRSKPIIYINPSTGSSDKSSAVSDSPKKDFSCSNCDFISSSANNLIVHMKYCENTPHLAHDKFKADYENLIMPASEKKALLRRLEKQIKRHVPEEEYLKVDYLRRKKRSR